MLKNIWNEYVPDNWMKHLILITYQNLPKFLKGYQQSLVKYTILPVLLICQDFNYYIYLEVL